MYQRSLSIAAGLLSLILIPSPLLAQSITPAADGTGTQVLQEGDSLQDGIAERYTITGGTRSRENLFHSFERLGLSADEIATFLSQPDIANILGRVTGGDASLIDGLLQVQGGNANLYLMNPAGIVFGPNARLDLSGSFFATTATGIGFGESWFNAIGDNTYGELVGNPDSFAFSLGEGGAIANLANLSVTPGESITLLGGTVTNTGTLSAPEGTITLAAVPGENRVRLSQAGSLLSLELDAANGTWDAALNPVNLTPLSLPELLTGGNLADASQITVNPNGTVRLGGADVPVQDGTTLVSGSLDASGTADAEINVLGDRVALLNASLDASGTNGGGNIRIGGDYQGNGSIFNATQTFVSQDSTISADALGNGNGGRVILWADDTTYFAGAIAAQGGSIAGDGGFVEVSGAQNLFFRGTADLSAPQGELGTLLLDPTNIVIVNGGAAADDGQLGAGVPAGDLAGQILAGQGAGLDYTISENALEALDGNANIVLEATNDIIVNPLADGVLTFAPGLGTITLTADAYSSGAGSFIMQAPANTLQALGRSLTISGAGITAGNIDLGDSTLNPAGNLTLTANNGNISVGTITTSANDDFAGDASFPGAGNVTLSAVNGSIATGTIDARAFIAGFPSGDGGDIAITARDAVQTGDIIAFSGDGFGGAITITSSNGSLTTGTLAALSFFGGGGQNITLTANDNITTGNLEAYGNFTNVGGTINVTTANGTITPGQIITDNNNILLNGPVLLNRDVTITIRGTTGTVTAAETINGSNALTVNTDADSTVAVNLNGAIGNSIPLGALTINTGGATQFGSTVTAASLQTDAGGTTQLSGDVTTTGANGQTYNDPLTLVGNIRLSGEEITLNNSVSGLGDLVLQPLRAEQAIALGGTDNGTNAFDLTGPELGQIQSTFRSITVGRPDSTGSITLSPTTLNAPITLAGGSTLTGANQLTTWTLTGPTSGSLSGFSAPLQFTNIETLQGGTANDTFAVADGVTWGGAIAGGSGTDVYDFSASTTALTVPLAPLVGQSIETLIGGASSTLVGGNTANTWTLTGSNGGTVNGIAFQQFQTLQGGTGSDTVILQPGGGVTGQLLGGAGGDRLVGGGASVTTGNSWVIADQTSGRVNGINFAGFEILQGSAGEDRFQFITDATFAGNIEGLTGPLQLAGSTVNLQGDILTEGEVSITANQGIQVGAIDTRLRDSAGSLTGPGQRITLTSRDGSITTGDLLASGTRGGTVTVTAATAITTGAIDTSATRGNGGAVTLDPIEDIQVELINAEGGDNGLGGTVDITAGRFFRATDAFTNRDGQRTSISTAGGLGGGAITIRHGGNGLTPFVIGDEFGDNGSRAAITNGFDTFAVGEALFTSEIRGTAQILTGGGVGGPPDLPPCQANCDDSEEVDGPGESVPEESDETLEVPTVLQAQERLLGVTERTGIPPALVYISFVSADVVLPNDFAQREAIASQQVAHHLGQPNPVEPPLLSTQPQPTDELELLLVLPNGEPVRYRVPGVTRDMVQRVQRNLVSEITAPNRRRLNRYLEPSQQLYQWLIAPLEADLESADIGSLAFVLDTGLRALPVSVLHNGEQFLVERYNLGLMPSLSLTDTQYRDLRNVPVLAMGASEFETLLPLPAVPTELKAVTSVVPNSIAFLNQEFTPENLLQSRFERPYGIVHLATHAEFLPGELENSFIQFGDRRLPLDAIRQLRLNNPPVELLVLSACRTALGDEQAELGFGGLAVQTGVRSVLASLWYVSDTGTLAFMNEFYRQLQEAPTRSEALRQTQLALLRGELQLQDDQLITTRGATVTLPPDLVDNSLDLTHPYFWASFTMIGSPW